MLHRTLTRFLQLLSILCAATCLASAQEASRAAGISDRADELDSSAVAYFGLFPRIPSVVRVRLVGTPPALMVTRRVAGGEIDTSMSVAPKRLAALRAYIDGYERLSPGRLASHLDALGDLAGPGGARSSSLAIYTITTRSGATLQGTLLAATDDAVLLWPEESSYDWRTIDTAARMIPVAMIDRIEHEGNNVMALVVGALCAAGSNLAFYNPIAENVSRQERLATGAAFGITAGIGTWERTGLDRAIGGNPLLFGEVAPTIRDDALFRSGMPPEAARFLAGRWERIGVTENMPAATAEEVASRYTLPRFSVRYASGVPLLAPINRAPSATGWIGDDEIRLGFAGVLRHIAVGYAAADRWNLELTYTMAPASVDARRKWEWFNGHDVAVTASYLITAPDPARGARLYFSGGLGLGYTIVDEHAALSLAGDTRMFRQVVGAPAGRVQLEVGSRVTRMLSLFVQLQAMQALPVEIGVRHIAGAGVPNGSLTLAAHEIDPSTSGLLIGVALHL